MAMKSAMRANLINHSKGAGNVQHHGEHSSAIEFANPLGREMDEKDEKAALLVQRIMRGKWARRDFKKTAEREPRVSLNVLYDYVKKEIDDENAYKGLFFTLSLIVSFILFSDGFLRGQLSFAIGDAIINDLEENANFAFVGPMGNKVFRDVHTVADFWSWVRLGALPIMIQPSWQYGERYPFHPDRSDAERMQQGASSDIFIHPDMASNSSAAPRLWIYPHEEDDYEPYIAPEKGNQYLLFNRVLGGVRLSQERAGKVTCRGPEGDWLGGKPCLSGKIMGYDIPPDHAFLPLQTTERVQWLKHTLDYQILHDTLTDMEDGCQLLAEKGRPEKCLCDSCVGPDGGQGSPWVDDGTMAVEISIYVYNPTYGVYSRVNVIFIFSRGGRIWKRINVQSASCMEAYDTYAFVFAVLWLAGVVWVIFGELAQIFGVIRKHGPKGIWTDYIAFSETVDWIAIWNSVSIVVNFAKYITGVQKLDQIAARWLENEDLLEELIDELDYTLLQSQWLRVSLGIYAVIIILRLFKAFDSNPRLAQVTRTLSSCMVDLFHFSVVFFSIFYMYAVAGTIFFGHRMAEFVTVFRGIRTCYIILLGEVDWEPMVKSAGRVVAMTWFMSFTMIILFVMFNMLIGIIFSTYDEVRSAIGADAETLWSQAYELFSRWKERRAGRQIHLSKVVKAMHEYAERIRKMPGTMYAAECDKNPDLDVDDLLSSDPQEVTPSKLLTWLKGVPPEQARTLVEEAKEIEDASKPSMEITPEILIKNVEVIQEQVGKRLSRVENMLEEFEKALDALQHAPPVAVVQSPRSSASPEAKVEPFSPPPPAVEPPETESMSPSRPADLSPKLPPIGSLPPVRPPPPSG
jgi:hypothetical protein